MHKGYTFSSSRYIYIYNEHLSFFVLISTLPTLKKAHSTNIQCTTYLLYLKVKISCSINSSFKVRKVCVAGQYQTLIIRRITCVLIIYRHSSVTNDSPVIQIERLKHVMSQIKIQSQAIFFGGGWKVHSKEIFVDNCSSWYN